MSERAVPCGVTTLMQKIFGADGPASGHHEFVATCTRLAGHEGEHEHFSLGGGTLRWSERTPWLSERAVEDDDVLTITEHLAMYERLYINTFDEITAYIGAVNDVLADQPSLRDRIHHAKTMKYVEIRASREQ